MHTHSIRRSLAAAVLVALASLAGTGVAVGQDQEVVVISERLEPKRLEVSAGTVVTWRNRDGERHRLRSRTGPVEFDSGNLGPGDRFSVTFVVPGEYPYLDERNDEDAAYHGTIVVIEGEPNGGPTALEATVTLIDESFQPPAIEVAVGGTVNWENIDGDDDHTVTSTDAAFDSGVLAPGSDFEHTFEAPGTYPYVCAIHPEMEGTVTVVGDAPVAPVESVAPPDAESLAPEPVTLSIVDLTFDPATVEVDVGATLTWTNEDGVPHTVTARDDDFNSGVLQGGGSFSQTFEEPGTYDYFCAIHPSMSGSVVVREPLASDVADDAGDGGSDAEATTVEVSIVGVAFEPADIEVAVGATVDWTNVDPFAHTVTATDGAFDSGTLDAGATFAQTFDEPGTYDYFCAIHPSMTGTVTVTP